MRNEVLRFAECGMREAQSGWSHRLWGSTGMLELEGSAAFTTGLGGGGFGSGNEGRGDNATARTQSLQLGPQRGRDELAEGGSAGAIRCISWVDEIKWPKEVVAGVGQVDGVGPGNVFGRVRGGGGWELNSGAIFNDAVGGHSVFVPQRPPAAMLFREGSVSSREGEEVAVEVARGKVGGCSLREVDLDKGELGAEGGLEAVGDEEEFVGGVGDGGEEVCWEGGIREGGV